MRGKERPERSIRAQGRLVLAGGVLIIAGAGDQILFTSRQEEAAPFKALQRYPVDLGQLHAMEQKVKMHEEAIAQAARSGSPAELNRLEAPVKTKEIAEARQIRDREKKQYELYVDKYNDLRPPAWRYWVDAGAATAGAGLVMVGLFNGRIKPPPKDKSVKK